MTECNQTAFAFEAHFSRQVVARFDGARMTTEGGALLLRAVDRKISLLKRLRICFHDARDPDRVDMLFLNYWRSAFTPWRWAMRI